MINLFEMTDEQLAVAYVDGNNKAFDLLLERNQSKLYSYILFMVHDRTIAEDVFQDTFLKAITRLQQGEYRISGKFCSWLMRIAHNIIIDMFREQKNDKVVEATEDNNLSNIMPADYVDECIETQFVNTQTLKEVKTLMNQLPDVQREVVYMRFFQELSFKEIAETTNVSINTALGRMRYAMLNMRRQAKVIV